MAYQARDRDPLFDSSMQAMIEKLESYFACRLDSRLSHQYPPLSCLGSSLLSW